MRTFILRSFVAILVLVAAVAPASAQTALTLTSASAAIAAADTAISVTSAAGAAANIGVFVNREYMVITAVSGTRLQVIRGAGGTIANAHAVNTPLWIGPQHAFVRTDPSGACVVGNTLYTPRINVETGLVWTCTNSRWSGTSFAGTFPANIPYRPITNANVTATIYDGIIAYTSITAARTVTLPSAVGLVGKMLIIKDELGAVTSTIAISITGTINGATTHSIVAAYGSILIYSNGTAWFLW
jgi:hypothetical protein